MILLGIKQWDCGYLLQKKSSCFSRKLTDKTTKQPSSPIKLESSLCCCTIQSFRFGDVWDVSFPVINCYTLVSPATSRNGKIHHYSLGELTISMAMFHSFFYITRTKIFSKINIQLPSGKKPHHYGKIQHFYCENLLFLWPFSKAIFIYIYT